MNYLSLDFVGFVAVVFLAYYIIPQKVRWGVLLLASLGFYALFDLKYVEKIIDLCEKKGVELIFYRAPYISTAGELKKSNWFTEYCQNKGITYVDLEKVIDFDINTDFLDYRHLNQYGAVKATDYLAPIIQEKLQ